MKLKEEAAAAQSAKLSGQVAVQELESLLTGNLKQRQQELQDRMAPEGFEAERGEMLRLSAEAEDAALALQVTLLAFLSVIKAVIEAPVICHVPGSRNCSAWTLCLCGH